MREGYVYVLSNPSMPGLLKIGRTSKDPRHRAAELFTTGVPSEFRLDFVWWTNEAAALESVLHGEFADARCESREFFRIDLSSVISFFVESVLIHQDRTAVSLEDDDVITRIREAAECAGVNPNDAIAAFRWINPDDVAEITNRYQDCANFVTSEGANNGTD